MAHGVCALACALMMAMAGMVLLDPDFARYCTLTLPLGLASGGTHFAMDTLSAFFLILVNGVGVIASLFGIGYAAHEKNKGQLLIFYPLFLLAMNMVLLASDAFAFLLSWEAMSLASWLLVLVQHHEAQNRRAAQVYLIMASLGTLALLLAIGLIAVAVPGEGFAMNPSFGDLAYGAGQLGSWATAAVVVLVLAGAGSKAGLAPTHAWLPLAHPAAPSHVSALMSGAMTKIALYALLRFLFIILPQAPAWSGWALLIMGLFSAGLGVLQSLMQNDGKKVLAFSTVENVGLIAAALGMALVHKAGGHAGAAILPLLAAMILMANHAAVKALLFCGAGAVLHATGERDMNKLGGLIHRMPTTALFVLMGCASMAALPFLGGLPGEWRLFHVFFEMARSSAWTMQIGGVFAAAFLALVAALAVAGMVRFFGMIFLGRARSEAAASAHEGTVSMKLALALPVILTLVLGLATPQFEALVAPVVAMLLDGVTPGSPTVSMGAYIALAVFLAFVATLVMLAVVRALWVNRAVRGGQPWACGQGDPGALAQYSPSGFSQPLRRVFNDLIYHSHEKVRMPPPSDISAAKLEFQMNDRVWDAIYRPIGQAVAWLSDHAEKLERITLRPNLVLMFGALILLLLIVWGLGA